MPEQEPQNDTDSTEITVTESKFQATAIYTVETDQGKDVAKALARQFFRDEYGHTPSKVIAEGNMVLSIDGNEKQYEIVVTDQSSGSLKESRTYNV